MALRQTAQNGASGNSSSLTLTFGSSVQAGSLIVFAINMNSPISISSITAGSGDTITYLTNGLGSGQKFYFGYIQNTAGSFTNFTINLSGTGWQIEAIAREYTNMLVSSVVDQNTGSTVSSTTSWSSGAMATTTQAADLIIAAGGVANTPATMSAGSAYGNLLTQATETAYAVTMEDQTVSATGAYTGTFTASVNSSGYMSVAAFKTNSMPFVVDSTTTSESITVQIPVKTTATESTTTSESYAQQIITKVSVSDSTTTSESVGSALAMLLTVSDSTATSEAYNAAVSSTIFATESTATSESYNAAISTNISVSDSTATSEVIGSALAQIIKVSDSTTTSESGINVFPFFDPHAGVSDNVTTSEVNSVVVHPYTNMPLRAADYIATSETYVISVISAFGKLPYLQENVTTSESININTQTITGWSVKNAVLYQNTFSGPTNENASGMVTTMGGSNSYLFQQYTCTQSTQYVTQCEVKGISSTTVTMAVVQHGVVLASNTVTMDGSWDTIAVPAFTTNPVDTTFQIQIYTQSPATIYVGAVMTQNGVGALTTYFDGATSATSSYIFSWSGTAQTSTSIATPVGSAVIEADFSDADGALPVTSVDAPIYNNPNLDSSYLTNFNQDASGSTGSSYIQLQSTNLNGSTYQMTFINTYSQPIYITQLTLYGTPAKVVYNINVEYKNPTSIALYGTNPTNNGQTLVIQNDLIQDPSTALSDAYTIVNDYSNPYQRMNVDVFPAYMLQIGDTVDITINDTGITQAYTVVGVTNGVGQDGAPQQSLEVEVKQLVHYFTINQSAIGGSDSIAP